MTLISSVRTLSPNPSNGEVNVSRANARIFPNVRSIYLLPQNFRRSKYATVFDTLPTNISKTPQSIPTYYLTKKIPNATLQNDEGLRTSDVQNLSYTNNLDSGTLNRPNLSHVIHQHYEVTNNTDKLQKIGSNNFPTEKFQRKLKDGRYAHPTVRYLPVTLSATSIKNYKDATLLIMAIFTMKIV